MHEIVTFYCGHCAACREGRYNICNKLKPMEGRAHYMTGGAFAKYVVWPEQQLHRLPDSIDSRDAVLMEPTAGSVHSVVTRMGVRAGESVAILGPGARGLLLMQVCRAVGAGPIYVTGLTRDEPFRLAMAKKMGADEAINVEKTDLRKRIAELTGGIGVDVVLENSGSVEPIEQSLDIVRKGGKVMWAGGGIRGGIVAPVDTYKIIVKELDIKGEISQVPYDWLTAIHLVKSRSVDLKPLVTHVYPLDKWRGGLRARGHELRVPPRRPQAIAGARESRPWTKATASPILRGSRPRPSWSTLTRPGRTWPTPLQWQGEPSACGPTSRPTSAPRSWRCSGLPASRGSSAPPWLRPRWPPGRGRATW